jgi:hypothetical protein
MREDSLAINCLLKQIEKDTIIIARGRRIESLQRVAKLDSTIIKQHKTDISLLTIQYNKCEKHKVRNVRISFLCGLLVGIIPFLLK